MAENTPIFLWNNEHKDVLAADIQIPLPTVTLDGISYYQSVFPQWYFTPCTDEAMANMMFVYAQNNNARLDTTDIEILYDRAFEAKLREAMPLPKDLPAYAKTSSIQLKDDVVGVYEDFNYTHYFHQHLKAQIEALPVLPKSILELGCGSGENLLFLKKNFPQIKIQGLEQSQHACTLGRKYAEHCGLDITLTCGNADDVALIQSLGPQDLVFTHFLVTLLSHEKAQKVLAGILSGNCSSVFLYEPFPEFWSCESPRGRASILYARLVNYLTGFFQQALNPSGPYRVTECTRLKNASNPLFEPGFIRYERI